MKCPACQNTLTEIKAGDVFVDVCQGGCGGVWFDEFELKKFDEPHEFAGEAILSAARNPSTIFDSNQIRHCPRCAGEELCRRYYDIKGQVEVDQCLRCSGIWLDVGELGSVRSQYTTEAERQQAADNYLAGLMDTTKNNLSEESKMRLAEWEEEVSFSGTLRSLFRGLF